MDTRQKLEMPMPRVEIEGAGTLSFPVSNAPYGKGDDTIVGTSIRKGWQTGKVKIGGESWAANFDNIFSKVKAGLGCDDTIFTPELYVLLVYDRGRASEETAFGRVLQFQIAEDTDALSIFEEGRVARQSRGSLRLLELSVDPFPA